MVASKTQVLENVERSFKSWSTYIMIFAGAVGTYFLSMSEAERNALMAQFPHLAPYSAVILTFAGVAVKWIQGSILTTKEKVDQSAQAVEFIKQMAAAGILLPTATANVIKAAPVKQEFADTQHVDIPLPTQEERVLATLESTVQTGPSAEEMIMAARVQFPNLSQKDIDQALRKYVAVLDIKPTVSSP